MSGPVTTGRIRVALVDDQTLVRSGLAMVVSSQPDLEVVAQADDGAEALQMLAATAVDVVLMDIRMRGMDGIEATRRLRRREAAATPQPKVIMLTTFDIDDYALAAVRAGASGFLLKDSPPEELLAAIRTVHRGDAVIAPSTTRRILDHVAPLLTAAADADDRARVLDALTERERAVLTEMARGRSNREIAARFSVGEATVKTHVGHVLAKLGARDRVHAVVIAYETGLVRPGDS